MAEPQYEAHVGTIMRGRRIRLPDGVVAGLDLTDGDQIVFYRKKGSTGHYRVGKLADLVRVSDEKGSEERE